MAAGTAAFRCQRSDSNRTGTKSTTVETKNDPKATMMPDDVGTVTAGWAAGPTYVWTSPWRAKTANSWRMNAATMPESIALTKAGTSCGRDRSGVCHAAENGALRIRNAPAASPRWDGLNSALRFCSMPNTECQAKSAAPEARKRTTPAAAGP